MSLPEGILLGWIGDDFTGSAASMEALEFAGIPSVLFLDIPTDAQLAEFSKTRAIGIATTARSHNPDWMEENLPPIFEFLKSKSAHVIHYKVCSTLDSAPHVGSIGKALEIGEKICGAQVIPFLVAAPVMRRYQAFGQLFAAAGDKVHRIDRHPVMAKHPVTPMSEADVALHLAQQTSIPTATLDIEGLAKQDALSDRQGIVALDAMTETHMRQAGALIWSLPRPVLTGGSQGVQYALIDHWQDIGELSHDIQTHGADPVEKIIAVSGSVSSITAAQISWAEKNGFEVIVLDATKLATEAADECGYEAALAALSRGRDPLICTARGPDDPSVAAMRTAIEKAKIDPEVANQKIGKTLGQVLKKLLLTTGVRRAVISGGDTSGHACRELGLYAFTALAPTIPGAALLTAYSSNPKLKGLQLALKGGQMGTEDYFGWIKRGGGAAQRRNIQ